MGYNALDIIDKSIEIEHRRNDLLQRILDESNNIPNKKICSTVLNAEIDRRIKRFNELKEKLLTQELKDIDIITYDKISFLISEFNKKAYFIKVNSLREFLDFSLELLYDKQALFIDIKGRIASNSVNIDGEAYNVVFEILNYISDEIEIVKSVHL